MSLTIEIEDYPVFVRIGWYESERKQGQEVLVSLKAQLSDVTSADSLNETTDYSDILAAIDRVLLDREINLIETAVQTVADTVLENFSKIHAMQVTIEKQILPGSIAKGGRVKVSYQKSRLN